MSTIFRMLITVVILAAATVLAFYHWLSTRRTQRSPHPQNTARINVTCHDK